MSAGPSTRALPIQVMRAEGAPYAVPAVAAAVGGSGAVGDAGVGALWQRGVQILTDVVDTASGLLTLRNASLVLAATLIVLVGWGLLKEAVTRWALRPGRRVRLLALPTETFDPSAEEVDRFAAQLSRARRSVCGSLDRPAQAVRLRLDSTGAGQCAYRIEGSERAASILRLAGYAEVELRPADAVDVYAQACPDHRGPPAADEGGFEQPDEECTTARQREGAGIDDRPPALFTATPSRSWSE